MMSPGLILLVALALIPFHAKAQFTRLSDAVKYRQSVFQVMSTHAQRIGAVAKGDAAFNRPEIETSAAIIEMLSKQLLTSFPPGSDMAPSKTKPEAWQELPQFKLNADQLQAAAAKLSSASKTGDLTAIKSAFNAVSQTCKACHDSYRNR